MRFSLLRKGNRSASVSSSPTYIELNPFLKTRHWNCPRPVELASCRSLPDCEIVCRVPKIGKNLCSLGKQVYSVSLQQEQYKVLNADQWASLLEFCKAIQPNFSNYDENGACAFHSPSLFLLFAPLGVLCFFFFFFYDLLTISGPCILDEWVAWAQKGDRIVEDKDVEAFWACRLLFVYLWKNGGSDYA